MGIIPCQSQVSEWHYYNATTHQIHFLNTVKSQIIQSSHMLAKYQFLPFIQPSGGGLTERGSSLTSGNAGLPGPQSQQTLSKLGEFVFIFLVFCLSDTP